MSKVCRSKPGGYNNRVLKFRTKYMLPGQVIVRLGRDHYVKRYRCGTELELPGLITCEDRLRLVKRKIWKPVYEDEP